MWSSKHELLVSLQVSSWQVELYNPTCCHSPPALVLRLSLIRPWRTTPCPTSPASSTESSSPSLTPLMTRYVIFGFLSAALIWFFFFPLKEASQHLSFRPRSLLPAGRRCHLHDLHHRAAHRVCGHGSDLQRPAQPERPRRGRCPDEGLSSCMFWALVNRLQRRHLAAMSRSRRPADPRSASSK